MLKNYLLIKIKLLIILILLFFFISCAGNDNTPTPETPPIAIQPTPPDPPDPPTTMPPDPPTPPDPPMPACNTSTPSSSGANDPLYGQQWYLKNTGQNAYADNGGVAGVDLNLTGVTQTGRGVVVNVVDTGMEIAHEDLKYNVVCGSINFNGGTDPTNTDSSGDHGTSVAGIIAASSNNVGGRGIAPEASLIAYNLLYPGLFNNINDIRAILATADINNQSYGRFPIYDIKADSAVEDAYIEGASSGRNGKGKIYVKGAGNNFFNSFYNPIFTCTYIIEGNRFNLALALFTEYFASCGNPNMDPYNTLPYNIVVAAMNASGTKASYSATGSAILISGFGGEIGLSSPAMITTDQSGCNKGYARSSSRNDFNKGSLPNVNQNCNYTSTFNGTSSATPTVAGVVALMLEANSNLSWRDVRHILVNTAKKVDSSRPANKTLHTKTPRTNKVDFLLDATTDLGWERNAVGHEFHNRYGFGLVDASAAVTMSQNYTSPLGDFQKIVATSDSSSSIPDKDFAGANSIINFPNNITIESIQIDIQVTHPFTAELGIWLKSPSGTESVLLPPFNDFSSYDTSEDKILINKDLDMVLASQAFYGEVARGDWELKIIDYIADNTGDVENWKLIIYGH